MTGKDRSERERLQTVVSSGMRMSATLMDLFLEKEGERWRRLANAMLRVPQSRIDTAFFLLLELADPLLVPVRVDTPLTTGQMKNSANTRRTFEETFPGEISRSVVNAIGDRASPGHPDTKVSLYEVKNGAAVSDLVGSFAHGVESLAFTPLQVYSYAVCNTERLLHEQWTSVCICQMPDGQMWFLILQPMGPKLHLQGGLVHTQRTVNSWSDKNPVMIVPPHVRLNVSERQGPDEELLACHPGSATP